MADKLFMGVMSSIHRATRAGAATGKRSWIADGERVEIVARTGRRLGGSLDFAGASPVGRLSGWCILARSGWLNCGGSQLADILRGCGLTIALEGRMVTMNGIHP